MEPDRVRCYDGGCGCSPVVPGLGITRAIVPAAAVAHVVRPIKAGVYRLRPSACVFNGRQRAQASSAQAQCEAPSRRPICWVIFSRRRLLRKPGFGQWRKQWLLGRPAAARSDGRLNWREVVSQESNVLVDRDPRGRTSLCVARLNEHGGYPVCRRMVTTLRTARVRFVRTVEGRWQRC